MQPKFGSKCSLLCSPHYLSSSSSQSYCTWRGVWSVKLECRPQVAALIGLAWTDEDPQGKPTVEVYPPTGNKLFLPPLPKVFILGSAGYIDGSLVFCGGADRADPTITPLASCYRLTPPLLEWKETFPLAQVISVLKLKPYTSHQAVYGASSAVHNNSLLVLGGLTYMYGNETEGMMSDSQLVRNAQKTDLTDDLDMNEAKCYHCSTSLDGGNIIMTGGRTSSNMFGSNTTEFYNATSHKWETKKRSMHSCTSVWLNPNFTKTEGGIIAQSVDRSSVLGIVISGGGAFLSFSLNHPLQVSTTMMIGPFTTPQVWRCICHGTTPGWSSLLSPS